jgi:hypothetical protein
MGSESPNWRINTQQKRTLNLSTSNGETLKLQRFTGTVSRENPKIVFKGSKPFFSVYEETDNAIGIEHNQENRPNIFFTITPMVLSVDIMQHAVNNGKILVTPDSNFMSFIDLPSLYVATNFYGSNSYNNSRSRQYANWCLIEENGTESKTFMRQPIQPIQPINNTSIPSISELQGIVTNEQVFLAPIKDSSDYDDRRLCLYRANVIYKQNESDKTGEPRELYERIDYLKYIAEWLENTEIKKTPKQNTNTKCDLYGLDDNYIITYKFINPNDGIEYILFVDIQIKKLKN